MTDKEILAYISDIKKEVEQATNFETKKHQKILFMLGKLHEEVYYQQIYKHLNHVLENEYDFYFRIIIKNLEKKHKFKFDVECYDSDHESLKFSKFYKNKFNLNIEE